MCFDSARPSVVGWLQFQVRKVGIFPAVRRVTLTLASEKCAEEPLPADLTPDLGWVESGPLDWSKSPRHCQGSWGTQTAQSRNLTSPTTAQACHSLQLRLHFQSMHLRRRRRCLLRSQLGTRFEQFSTNWTADLVTWDEEVEFQVGEGSLEGRCAKPWDS